MAPTKDHFARFTYIGCEALYLSGDSYMRRTIILGSIAAVAIGTVAVVWLTRSPAQQPVQNLNARQADGGGPSLPLSQVVLFSSGVGYFQREGEVDGNARIDLQFPIGDVNDLLKSMVL